MGGISSTRWGWHTPRPTVEDGLTLTLSKLLRDGMVKAGAWAHGSLRWTRTRTGEQIAAVGYEANLLDPSDGWIRLHYTVTRDGVARSQNYRIRLATSPQTFGGVRWWFVCPRTGGRVAKIHLPPGADMFASRKAHGLAYHSQRLGPADRARETAQEIRIQLGGTGDMFAAFPPKPKRMHWSTYQRLREKARAAEGVSMDALAAILERIKKAETRSTRR
jgi:hypothetical protein